MGGCLHPGGLHQGVCIQGGSASSRGVCFLRGGWAADPHQTLWDMVNEQAVRILLECILVCRYNYVVKSVGSPKTGVSTHFKYFENASKLY